MAKLLEYPMCSYTLEDLTKTRNRGDELVGPSNLICSTTDIKEEEKGSVLCYLGQNSCIHMLVSTENLTQYANLIIAVNRFTE